MPAMSTAEKLMIVGLDCVPPEIVFDDMRNELPVLSGLMERGAWGRLESCDPPITVPAWSCMMSSRDPGTLGFYGFRNRKDHSYDGLAFATSDKVRVERLWDMLSREGKHVIHTVYLAARNEEMGTLKAGQGLCRVAFDQRSAPFPPGCHGFENSSVAGGCRFRNAALPSRKELQQQSPKIFTAK